MEGQETVTQEVTPEPSLSDIFSNAEPEAVADDATPDDKATGEDESTAEAEEAAPEEKEAVEEESKESTPDSEKKDEPWHITAVMNEREKRQKAEARLAELEKSAKPDEDRQPTSVFENEELFTRELVGQVDNQLTNAMINMSEFHARDKFGDEVIDEKIGVFKELVNSNPALAQQFSNAVSPYHELVKIVDQHEEVQKMGNIDEYKAKLKAELREELKAELEAEKTESEQKEDAKRSAITPSLANKRSSGGNDDLVEDTLEDVFQGR